jgi:hypothetical protein
VDNFVDNPHFMGVPSCRGKNRPVENYSWDALKNPCPCTKSRDRDYRERKSKGRL